MSPLPSSLLACFFSGYPKNVGGIQGFFPAKNQDNNVGFFFPPPCRTPQQFVGCDEIQVRLKYSESINTNNAKQYNTFLLFIPGTEIAPPKSFTTTFSPSSTPSPSYPFEHKYGFLQPYSSAQLPVLSEMTRQIYNLRREPPKGALLKSNCQVPTQIAPFVTASEEGKIARYKKWQKNRDLGGGKYT